MFIPRPSDLFGAAILQGMAASPFQASSDEPLYIRINETDRPLEGCLVHTEHHVESFDVTGIQPGFHLTVHIPKTSVEAKPRVNFDALVYLGRVYSITTVSGDGAFSPVWAAKAVSPLKS